MQYQVIDHLSELPEGKGKILKIAAREIALFHIDGSFYALDSLCAHQRAPLVQGEVIDGQLLCPWHGNTFDLSSGRCLANPEEKVRTYPVRVQGEAVWIEIVDTAA
ncbi:MAG: non-heme iron oxygenase ferredoxin subunit [Nitrospirae bacterium]|nr:non-heme iron oxygenase ferredoxin subunit [Candidatus Manganitrophaceae bacterium]